jgi:hypothetical protein
MSLDKAIEHKQEKRKPYRRAKAVDPTCRNHGSDIWSKNNRTFDRKDYDWEKELREEH